MKDFSSIAGGSGFTLVFGTVLGNITYTSLIEVLIFGILGGAAGYIGKWMCIWIGNKLKTISLPWKN